MHEIAVDVYHEGTAITIDAQQPEEVTHTIQRPTVSVSQFSMYGIEFYAPGPQGPAATVNVGTTTTSAPGSPANVINVGTEYQAVLDFYIPEGLRGLQGEVAVDSTITGTPGTSALVEDLDPSPNRSLLRFTIPRGATGATGPGGVPGGPAGGDLAGTYPNPTLAVDRVKKTGDTMSNFLTLHADPSSNMHAATKLYVDTKVGAGGMNRTISVISGNTSAAGTAKTDFMYVCTAALTLTLPTAVGNTNLYTVKRTGTGNVTVATTASQTIDGVATFVLDVQYMAVNFVSTGTNWVVC